MRARIATALLLLAGAWTAQGGELELERQVQALVKQVEALQAEIREIKATQQAQAAAPAAAPVEAARAATGAGTAAPAETVVLEDSEPVELESNESPSIGDQHFAHVLANPWWENFDISGFGAAGFYDTGPGAARDNGGFEIKEASLFIEADVWEDIAFFLELQTNRLGKDRDLFARTGEVYAHFRNLHITDTISFGLKAGRFDIPFGEEYLWQDAIDNPMIQNSAIYPYGWDEGLLLYGELHEVGWIVAVTDGTDTRSFEENSDKAVNFKVYGNPLEPLYLSLSFMATGDTSESGIEFGGSHIQPVGAEHPSSLGASASAEIGAKLLQADAKYEYSLFSRNGYLAISLGGAQLDDDDSTFDRDLLWFSVEPYFAFTDQWYGIVRYSSIGTFNDGEGYHFDGKIFAGGNTAFGYDTEQFSRLGIGIGWRPYPRLRAKFEVGKDWFDLINHSPLMRNTDDREFVGAEVAVGF